MTYQIKGFGHLINFKRERINFGNRVSSRVEKRDLRVPVGFNYANSQNIPNVTYQTKGFDFPMNITM